MGNAIGPSLVIAAAEMRSAPFVPEFAINFKGSTPRGKGPLSILGEMFGKVVEQRNLPIKTGKADCMGEGAKLNGHWSA